MLDLASSESPTRYQTPALSDMQMLAQLERAAAPYRAAGYTVISQTAWSMTLAHTRRDFSLFWYIVLWGVFWPAAIYYSRTTRKERLACLRITSSGEVVEEGATLDHRARQSGREASAHAASTHEAFAHEATTRTYNLKLVIGVIAAMVLIPIAAAMILAPKNSSSTPPAMVQSVIPSTAVPTPQASQRGGAKRAGKPPSSSFSESSAARRAILNTVREDVEDEAGQAVVLQDVNLSVKNGWACITAQMRDKAGNPVRIEGADATSQVVAVLHASSAGWRIEALEVGGGADALSRLRSAVPGAPEEVFAAHAAPQKEEGKK